LKTLVVGASGATGRLLVEELLNRDQKVRVIVRSEDSLLEYVKNHNNLEIVKATLLDLSDTELQKYVKDVDAIASCLGHNISLKGLFGKPRKLVTDATRRLCEAVKSNAPKNKVKFALMNTIANSNRDLDEPSSKKVKMVIGLLRLFLPPHPDNEQAADYLRVKIGQTDNTIEWVAVRPSGLTDEDKVTEYEVYTSPLGDAALDPGKISRINTGHFMAELITDDKVWNEWKGQMPVMYNKETSDKN
jgi:nucleoside-diphosphate-sugar epimerase